MASLTKFTGIIHERNWNEICDVKYLAVIWNQSKDGIILGLNTRNDTNDSYHVELNMEEIEKVLHIVKELIKVRA